MRFLSVIFASIFFTLLFPGLVFANNPDQPHSSLTSTTVPADGKTQAIITVILLDKNGSPVVGHSVSLSDPNNSSAGITTINGTSTATGQVQFGITSSNAQTDSLNILDITSGSVLDGLGTVTFFSLVPTAAGYCPNTAPASYPVIISAVASGQGQITLNWLPAAGSVTYYVLSYGIASGNYPYGNPNIGNVTSYTISSLKPGTRYYFSLKGVNVCKPGPSSNEFSAVTLGGTAGAVPTVMVTTKPSVPTPTLGVVQPIVSPTKQKPAVLPELQPTKSPSPTRVLGIDTNTSVTFFLFFFIIIIAGGVYWKHHHRSKRLFLRKADS